LHQQQGPRSVSTPSSTSNTADLRINLIVMAAHQGVRNLHYRSRPGPSATIRQEACLARVWNQTLTLDFVRYGGCSSSSSGFGPGIATQMLDAQHHHIFAKPLTSGCLTSPPSSRGSSGRRRAVIVGEIQEQGS